MRPDSTAPSTPDQQAATHSNAGLSTATTGIRPAYRATALIVLTSLILACIVTVFVVFSCHNQQLENMRRDHDQSLRAYSFPLINSIERVDTRQTQSLIDSMVMASGVDHVTIHRKSQSSLAAGHAPENLMHLTQFDLGTDINGKERLVGRIVLSTGNSRYHENMRELILESFGINILRFLLIGVFGMLIYRLFIGRHLRTLAQVARQRNRGVGSEVVKLDDTFGMPPLNDIQQIATALNGASHNTGLDDSSSSEHLQSKLDLASQRLKAQAPLARIGAQLGTVVHEVRNPIAVLRASTQLLKLRLQKSHPELDPLLRRIDNSAERCVRIIEMTRDMAKGQAKNTEHTALHSWLTDYLAQIELPDHITLKLKLEETPLYATINTFNLGQILRNFIDNAVHAVSETLELKEHPKPKRFHITVSLTQISPDTVAIDVTDNGCGLDRADLGQMFEPLYTTKPKGIGLGLSICTELAESLGGQLSLSANGNGTRARISLRLAAPLPPQES